MIRIVDVHKSYGKTKALKGINLTIESGAVYGFVGPDGAGKTTLLRILCGLSKLDKGQLTINELSPILYRQEIGYVPQLFGLYPNLTVRENMELYGRLHSLPSDILEERCNSLANFVGLGDFQHRMANDLSGGMKQKLALGVALINNPSLLVLDEPSTGVDPLSRRELWALILELNKKGTTVIVATPFMDEADYCTELAFFEEGQILETGSPKSLREKFQVPSHRPLDDVYIHLAGGNVSSDYAMIQKYERLANKPLVIETQDLIRRFGEFTAVNKLNLKIQEGEIFGFLGSNGCGKSTTIRMLCGTLLPTSGTIKVLGTDVVEHVDEIKSRVGYMSQKFSLYRDITVMENLQFYGRIYGLHKEVLRQRIEEISDLLDIEKLLLEYVVNLPTGWRQRVSLGCAILHKPKVLYLDEPTSGVDPITRRQFWNIINLLAKEGTTVLVTTHFMDEAVQCDRILFMDKGRKLVEGRPKQLQADISSAKNLEDVFIYYMKLTRGEVSA